MISRKTIGFIVTILGVALVALQAIIKQDLGINPQEFAIAIGATLTYIFFEAKLDLRVLKTQPKKWRDPKFWLTVVSIVLTGVEQSFNLGIPVAEIVTGLTTLVGLLFGLKFKLGKSAY